MLHGFFQPCVGMLAHGDQIHPDIPMAGAASPRGFELVVDFLALYRALDSGAKRVTCSPCLAVAANTGKETWVIGSGCIERSSVIGRRARMWASPLANLGGTAPLGALTARTPAPGNHFSANGAKGNAIGVDVHFMVYHLPGTPEIQVDDSRNLLMFQQGIDREGIVG